MRRSLRLRLLALSLAVAALSVVATALLATYGTGTRLREDAESSASLLETDSSIHDALLDFAAEHRSWDGVEPLVAELARRTGRRVELTTPDGQTIAGSGRLPGRDAGDRPSTPSARIDAARPPDPLADSSGRPGFLAGERSARLALAYTGWQMTEAEQRERQALAGQAVSCLREEGIDATVVDGFTPYTGALGDARFAAPNRLFATGEGDAARLQEQADACVPDRLSEPSDATRALNERAVRLATACLEEHGLAYELAANAAGLRLVQPAGPGGERSAAWTRCEDEARIAAARPYVAPPADLYLGSSDRFAPFSGEGWWRTAATVTAVLMAAAAVTVLAGRRLVRPILALTGAAQRMEAGDHTARVPVPPRGGDEVTRLADAFNAMAAAIESSDLQRKALVSDVAHELRTPLANVRAHLEAAEDGVVPLDAELVRSLQEESALLERLVSDLQDLALADAGMLRVHPEERDAADLAGQAVAAYRARAEAAGVEVRVAVPPEPVPVLADPARLRQALGNLVANAVTHTPAGGSVEVAVRHGDERTRNAVVLTVADTGRGIAPEHLPYVFDRFYRADPSRSRSTGGSGLGLAITRHLVEAHHGRVEVHSTPGEGSTFTIRLPTPQPEHDSRPPP
ncbi:HAMP domain-containing sensor histidine kinase [Streptomyces sp. DSM 44917]|uniref:histidine kinase n=1 Tax=Streptomyces boetiae TaxID=3075541 RepID=A0ABU2LA49_9ACTN|nr:HAMP domain-containing sensor histidine kinase [Streptomyces sp. DSM 44917]MDT0308450.1 HAMP domain-containing sensor histidine kinase [Streptomyces sp. DSM 44917]